VWELRLPFSDNNTGWKNMFLPSALVVPFFQKKSLTAFIITFLHIIEATRLSNVNCSVRHYQVLSNMGEARSNRNLRVVGGRDVVLMNVWK
jgi:hypothetical protein